MQDFLKNLEEAELVLVGIGEEFDAIKLLRTKEKYNQGRKFIEEQELQWLLPAYDGWYRKQIICEGDNFKLDDKIQKALKNLEKLLNNKNYFVVSTAFNDKISQIPWKDKRLVVPCGGSMKKQCAMKCASGLQQITEDELQSVEKWFLTLNEQAGLQEKEQQEVVNTISVPELGYCPECGTPLILNSVYAEKYDENGYLEQWQLYTKWLQGTVNRKVLILELGVGMKFPSIIRWPFEKVTFFNQKASFYRVNESLYQLTEEIKEKGTSIQKNSVEWLLSLC